MKFLIPTAKELNALPKEAQQAQALSPKSQTIIDQLAQLAQLDQLDLAKFYKIKPEAAALEKERIHALKEGRAQLMPALELFNGLMYRKIDRDLTDEELKFTKEHIFITSALYGIINALEPISPHRLDFASPLKLDRKSLKLYWRTDYTAFIEDQQEPVVSLLSSEFEAVFSPNASKRLIKVSFYEQRGNQLKSHSTISKKARGSFLSQVIKHQIQSVAELKDLVFDDFHYQKDLSSEQQLVFVKLVS